MNTIDPDRAAELARRVVALRTWARGLYTCEAGVELLIRAWGGRLLTGPWIVTDPADGTVWFDTRKVSEAGYLSGGERRMLELAASITADRPIHLGDTLSGLERHATELVLAAVAHAAGTHEHSEMTFDVDGRPTGFERLTSLHPWPHS